MIEKLGVFQGLPGVFQPLGAFCSRAKAEEIRAFFAKNPLPAAARLLQQSLERIETCAAIDERQSAPFAAWLKRSDCRLAGRPAARDPKSASRVL